MRVEPERDDVLAEVLAGDFDVDLVPGFAPERPEVAREDSAGDLDDVARDEDAFVDFDFEAGIFCFVATGVRDSLVAPSARREKAYRSGAPPGRMRRNSTFGHVRRYQGTTFSLTPKGYP